MTKRDPNTGELIPTVVHHGVFHNWPWKIVSDGEPEEWTLFINHGPSTSVMATSGWRYIKQVPAGTTAEQVEQYMTEQGYGR